MLICAVVLSGSLTLIFNGLLRAGYFPSIWKSLFIYCLYLDPIFPITGILPSAQCYSQVDGETGNGLSLFLIRSL